MVMYWFAYGLMNRSIDKWFSTPVEEVRADTDAMASLLASYAAQNARSEAIAIAAAPETQRAFEGHGFAAAIEEFRIHEPTLQGGFAVRHTKRSGGGEPRSSRALGSFEGETATRTGSRRTTRPFTWEQTEYTLGSAPVGKDGLILVAMPLPAEFSKTVKQIEASQLRYLQLSRERKTCAPDLHGSAACC